MSLATSHDARHAVSLHTTTLKAFARALAREAHVLTRHPGLLWQQTYNRLQWDGDEIQRALASEYSWRCLPGSGPWIRLETLFKESGTVMRTLQGHANSITGCAFSPDGLYIVSFSADPAARIWDARDGQFLHTLDDAPAHLFAYAFTSSTLLHACDQRDNTIYVWDITTGELLRTIEGPSSGMVACAFSPDARLIVSADFDKHLHLWDAESRQILYHLVGHTDYITGCAYSPDGKWIGSIGLDDTLRIWEAASGRLRHSIQLPNPKSCTFSPDGRVIASTGLTNVQLWDPSTGRLLRTMDRQTAYVGACAFSPDARFVVSASDQQSLQVWDAHTGASLQTLTGHTARVNACSFSPDARVIVSASDDRSLRIWEVCTAQDADSDRETESRRAICAYSPDGRRVIMETSRGQMELCDAATGQAIRVFAAGSGGLSSFSPDGSLFLARADKTLRVWAAASGAELPPLAGHSSSILHFEFSPDGRHLVTSSKDKTLRIWDVYTGATLDVLQGHDAPVDACKYSPDGRLIVSSSGDRFLRAWDATTGQLLYTAEYESDNVRSFAFSPDGQTLAAVAQSSHYGAAYNLRIWDAKTGQLLHRLEGKATDCRYSPDGALLACLGDRSLDVWRLEVLERPQSVKGSGWIKSYAFSADGKWIVMSCQDNELRVADARTGAIVCILPLPGIPVGLFVQPLSLRMTCSVAGDTLCKAEMQGVEAAPIIVTPIEAAQGIQLRCPSCRTLFPVDKSDLGQVLHCPQAECHLQIRVNPFSLKLALDRAQVPDEKEQGTTTSLLVAIEAGKKAFDSGDYSMAVGYFELALAERPNSPEILSLRARALMDARELRSPTPGVPEAPESLAERAKVLLAHDDLAGALELYRAQQEVCRLSGDRERLQQAIDQEARLLHNKDPNRALILYQEEAQLCRELGKSENLALCLLGQAGILFSFHQDGDATKLVEESLRITRKYGYDYITESVLDTWPQFKASGIVGRMLRK